MDSGILLLGPDAKERPFYVVGSFDPRTATRGPAPNKLETPELSKRIRKLTRDGHWAVARAAGGGGELRSHPLEAPPCTQLRTFELFAGCGGLGEGMRQVSRRVRRQARCVCVFVCVVLGDRKSPLPSDQLHGYITTTVPAACPSVPTASHLPFYAHVLPHRCRPTISCRP